MEELKKEGEIQIDDLDRSFLWKKARQDAKGVFVNDATKEKAMEIDDLIQQVKEGTVVTSGRDDVLSLALGNPDHSGKVRAVGQFVTPSSYFHIPRPKLCDEREARKKAEEELRETKDRLSRVEEQLRQIIRDRAKEAKPTQSSKKKSSHAEKDRLSRLEEQLAILLQEKMATPSTSREKTYPCANNPSSSVSSQPAILINDKEKPITDEMVQSDSNLGLGKGKPCKLAVAIRTNVVASGLVFASTETEM